VGPGKIYRNRPLVLDTYTNRIAALYHATKVLDVTFVPGVDRRLRPHSNLHAHLIWTPRMTEKRLLGEIGEKLRDILKDICGELQIEIITGELHPDHIHLFLSYPPDLCVTEMIQKLKRKSSYRMLQEVPDLKKQHIGKGLWGRGYLVGSSGSINDEVIHKYLQRQGHDA
jgi:putative transposase